MQIFRPIFTLALLCTGLFSFAQHQAERTEGSLSITELAKVTPEEKRGEAASTKGQSSDVVHNGAKFSKDPVCTIIPQPVSTQWLEGAFSIDPHTVLVADTSDSPSADFFNFSTKLSAVSAHATTLT